MWKVIGILSNNERACGDVRNPVHGPMPRKVWIADGKRQRISRKPTNGLKSAESPLDYNTRRAALYARWLAARDGVALPDDAIASVAFDTLHVNGKRERRAREVHFFENTSTRWSSQRGKLIATIAIPHWDWTPAEPVEELIEDDVLPLAA